MNALILTAGFGTRLLPYTASIPKPLFTLDSKPILAHTIDTLIRAGCSRIVINTHHLADRIESFIRQMKPAADVRLLYEPDILDTGGAIANAAPLLGEAPFFVVNADVVCSIDLKKVREFHQAGGQLATLVLHDCERFNTVGVDRDGFITGFNAGRHALAFTGIQILSPGIYDRLLPEKVFSSIDLYKSLCSRKAVRAFVDKQIFWADIGTPEQYQQTAMACLCAAHFQLDHARIPEIRIERIAGDGSDRRWYRAAANGRTVVVSSHGICMPGSEAEKQLTAFTDIGAHLYAQGIPVPEIIAHDCLSGMVLVRDLGETHLESVVLNQTHQSRVIRIYRQVIDALIRFSKQGHLNFSPAWTCQTETYSKALILDRECRYFMDAFIRSYLGLDFSYAQFEREFEYIAENALKHGFTGLMHRDLQSRNIMIRDKKVFLIDFQAARTGPLQYDLAALLIDPYVGLDRAVREILVDYAMDRLSIPPHRRKAFRRCYRFCCLTRNLQFLGAFAFLSRVKQKKQFERYIPDAVRSLKELIRFPAAHKIAGLKQLILGLAQPDNPAGRGRTGY